jgi:hypothetical protein
MRKSAGNGASLRSRPRGGRGKAQRFTMPFALPLVTHDQLPGPGPEAPIQDEKKAPAPLLERRLKVRRIIRGPSTNLRERPF